MEEMKCIGRKNSEIRKIKIKQIKRLPKEKETCEISLL